MKRISFSLFAAMQMLALTSTVALSHAFLERAVPGVGSTIVTSPTGLDLTFTENVVLSFCGVTVAAESGTGIAIGRPSLADGKTLHVPLGRPLPPGLYVVRWHVVAVDTHPTSGSYRFTIAP